MANRHAVSPGEPQEDAPAAPGKKVWVNVVTALFLLGFVVATITYNKSIKTRAKVGQPVPDLKVEDMSGRPVALSGFLGQPVLLNLWTTWCTSCREETPALQAFHERYGEKMKVVGLDVKEPVATIEEYVDFYDITFLILRDKKGDAVSRYNIRGYPETWFVDKGGVARKYWEGPLTFELMQGFYQETTGQPIDQARVGAVQAGGRLQAAGLPAGVTNGVPALFAGTTNGLFTSTDGGRWQLFNPEDKPLSVGGITALAFPVGAPELMFAAGNNIGVRRSRDGGRRWEDAGGGLPSKDVRALASDPAGKVLYAWVAGGGLHRSGDGGASWQAVPGLDPSLPVTALAVDPRIPGRLLLAAAQEGQLGWRGKLFESADGGSRWAEIEVKETIRGIEFAPAVFGIAFDPGRPDRVYLATSRGIWKSEAGGNRATWLRKSHMREMSGVAAAAGPDGRTWLLAGAPNGDMYLSEDGGAGWRLLTK